MDVWAVVLISVASLVVVGACVIGTWSDSKHRFVLCSFSGVTNRATLLEEARVSEFDLDFVLFHKAMSEAPSFVSLAAFRD